MTNQSEVARIREQIDQEVSAMRQAMQGFASVARHEIIAHHYKALDSYYEALTAQVGESAATEVMIEKVEQSVMNEMISLQTITHWQRKAREAEQAGNQERDWDGYGILLLAYQEAIQRAPKTAEACEACDIVQVLGDELAALADVLVMLFPRGGLDEFATYTTGARVRTLQERMEQG